MKAYIAVGQNTHMFQKSAEKSVHCDISLDHVFNISSGQRSISGPMSSPNVELTHHARHRRHHLVVVVPQLQRQGHREGLEQVLKKSYFGSQ